MQRFKVVEPAVCRKMTREEMEYEEGGWLNFLVSVACVGASVIVDYAGDQGWISKDTAKGLSITLTVAGSCASFGLSGIAMSGTKVMAAEGAKGLAKITTQHVVHDVEYTASNAVGFICGTTTSSIASGVSVSYSINGDSNMAVSGISAICQLFALL